MEISFFPRFEAKTRSKRVGGNEDLVQGELADSRWLKKKIRNCVPFVSMSQVLHLDRH